MFDLIFSSLKGKQKAQVDKNCNNSNNIYTFIEIKDKISHSYRHRKFPKTSETLYMMDFVQNYMKSVDICPYYIAFAKKNYTYFQRFQPIPGG